jgi:REP-associated tyrosine transposase
MSKPERNSREESLRGIERTFFVTSKTAQGKALLQSEQHAMLLIDTMKSYAAANRFVIHDFVVMPNHHVLMTVDNLSSIEKAMQLIKGGFSYRIKKEVGYQGEVWQRGFSEVRILDRASFLKHRNYIEQNPVKAGLTDKPENFLFGSAYFKKQNAEAKAKSFFIAFDMSKLMP